jgi:hypothetical protein
LEQSDGCEVSPSQLKHFAQSLKSPLESLSFAQVHWMSDEHVAAFLPVMGRDLTSLELIDCVVFQTGEFGVDVDAEDEGEEDREQVVHLTDAGIAVVARECRRLESLSITDSETTATGLAEVLQANSALRTLDLSSSTSLGRDAAGVIAMCTPHLITLRNCWGGNPPWLDDDGIITIMNGQLKASKGKGVSLRTIGLQSDWDVTNRNHD